ncbi:MAG: fibronectin type III domain-containing protein, partial [Candidatus Sericytochromatia bacterium]
MLKHRHNAQMVAAICALTLSACGPGPTSPTASSPPSPGTSSSPVSGVQPTAGPTTPNSATELTVKLQADSALSVFATQQVNEFPLCLARISRASTRISLDASLPESARAALTAAGVSLSSENGKTILTIERELNLAVLLAGVELHFGAVPDGNAEGRTTFFDHDGKELGFVSWQASLSSAARSISVRLKPHGTVNASESCPSLDAEVSGATFLGAGGQVVATQPLPNPQTSPSSEPSPGPSASPVGPAPGAPLNAKVVEQTSSSLTLQWDFPADARSFRLYLDGVQVAQDYVSPNYYRFEGLRSSTTYRLGVQSVNPAGSSEIVTVTTATTGSGSTASGNFSGGGSSGRRITTGKLTAEAIGDEFQVNENTTRIQIFSPVAMDADGDFVVA